MTSDLRDLRVEVLEVEVDVDCTLKPHLLKERRESVMRSG